MKKTISILLSLFMLLSLALTGCATEQTETQRSETTEILLQIGNPNMTVNGTEKPIDAEGTVPVLLNDRTLLPVRAVVEEMGGTVGWDDAAQAVTLHYATDEIRLVIDDTTASLNGTPQTLDTAPAIRNDRTMLPIRFIAESFHFEVVWNEAEQKVSITKTVHAGEQTPAPATKPTANSLVIYFSATGTTKAFAENIAKTAEADLYEIVPKVPYTSADLNYNSDCRANSEQQDDTARPELEPITVNIADYDTIFIGYPIWWGTMPKIINTFLEAYDLSGKTVFPFCTSGGSGISSSVSAIRSICPDADVKDGMRGSSSTSAGQIEEWLNANGFHKKADLPGETSGMLAIQAGGTALTAELADNSSAAALKDLLSKGDITIEMHDYSNFEKVGPLGTSLPRNDEQITTEAGDLILYQGNSFVIYYDTNTWNFTRLGKIKDVTQSELKEILGGGNVTVTLSMDK